MTDEASKHPGGRPTLYTEELAAFICAEIASGEKVSDICQAETMPCTSTVYLWLSKYKEFSDHYAQAQSDRTHAMAEECLDIADDGRNDWMEKHYGETTAWVTNGEALQRSRLRVDTRKWLMSKMAPKKYGEKVSQEISGPDGGAIEMKGTAIELIESRIASIIARAATQGSPEGSEPNTG